LQSQKSVWVPLNTRDEANYCITTWASTIAITQDYLGLHLLVLLRNSALNSVLQALFFFNLFCFVILLSPLFCRRYFACNLPACTWTGGLSRLWPGLEVEVVS